MTVLASSTRAIKIAVLAPATAARLVCTHEHPSAAHVDTDRGQYSGGHGPAEGYQANYDQREQHCFLGGGWIAAIAAIHR